MNRPSRIAVGASNAAASQRSSSRSRVATPRRETPANARWLTRSLTAIARSSAPRRGGCSALEQGAACRCASHVDLLQLARSPLHRLFRRHALDGLSVHVDDNVLAERFGCFAVRRTSVTGELRAAGHRAERRHDRVLVPDGVVFPRGGGADRITSLGIEPLLIDRLGMDPGQELLGGVLLLAVAHQHIGVRELIGEFSRRPLRQGAVQNVLVQRLPFFVLIFVGSALGDQIDGSTILRRRDRPGKERAVIARVIPGQAAFVATILPESDPEFNGLDCFLAIESDFAALVDFPAAVCPKKGIPEARRIAEAVPQRLSYRLAFSL